MENKNAEIILPFGSVSSEPKQHYNPSVKLSLHKDKEAIASALEAASQNSTITPQSTHRVDKDKASTDAAQQAALATPISPWPNCTITPLVHGSEAWKQARRLGISASDLPILMGSVSYSTPFKLWQDKLEGTSQESTRQMEYGLHMEPLLTKWVEEDLGSPVQLANWLVVSKDEPAFMATIDCTITPSGSRAPLIVELKTAVGVDSSAWEEEGVPESYYNQVQWQLYVTGCPLGYLACLPAGNSNRFMIREVEADPVLQDKMVKIAKDFLVLLRTKKAPPASSEDINRLPLSELATEQYEADEAFLQLYREHAKLAAKKNSQTTGLAKLEKEMKDYKARMAQLMGAKSGSSFQLDGKMVTVTRKLIKVAPKAASSYQKVDIKED